MSMSSSLKDKQIGKEQMIFNKHSKGEISVNSQNFLVCIAERMMNIVSRMHNKDQYGVEQIQQNS